MAKTFQPYEPEQSLLFPPSPRDWLPEGHLAYFVMDVVRELDLGDIHAHYEKELRGYPPYHPQMMTALLLYGYCSGVASSRKIERKTYEDVAFRVIAAGHHPDHTAISEFRRIHLEALAGLFVQVLQLCRKAGLVKLGHVALDGTKVKANASKHKAMSYERMKREGNGAEDEGEGAPGSGEERGRLRGPEVRREPARRRIAGRTAAGEESAGEDPRGEEGARRGSGARSERWRWWKRNISPQTSRAGNEGREADAESATEFHRCRELHPEERRWICAGLQRTGRGR